MMAGLLRALGGWKGYAAVALASALAAGAAGWAAQGWRKDARIAQIQLDQAAERRRQDRAALAAFDALLTENARRYAALEQTRDQAQQQAAQARADAASARGARQRLQQRVDALLADARTRNPALADGGPTTGAPVDMLAHVLGRALDAAGQLAEYADSAHIAGLTCERAYDTLRNKQ